MSNLSDMITNRFMGLMSGKLKLTDFPEYMAAEERLRRMGGLNRLGLGRQLSAAGVTGPAMGLALGRSQENELAPMGGLLTSIPERAADWAKFQEQLALQEKLGMGALVQHRKARKAQSAGVNLGILGRWGG